MQFVCSNSHVTQSGSRILASPDITAGSNRAAKGMRRTLIAACTSMSVMASQRDAGRGSAARQYSRTIRSV